MNASALKATAHQNVLPKAVRLFAAKGYAATTVEEIADAAAISPRAFSPSRPTASNISRRCSRTSGACAPTPFACG